MGGLLILIAISVSTLLWADLSNPFVGTILLVTIGFGLVGFADDYLKLTKRNTRGLPGTLKLAAQIVIAIAAVAMVTWRSGRNWRPVWRPLPERSADPARHRLLALRGVRHGWRVQRRQFDGRFDGLATVPVMIAAGCFALIAYLVGNTVFSSYLVSTTSPAPASWRCFAAPWWRRFGVFVVQRAPGEGFHGGHRLAVDGRRTRRDQRDHQA